MFWRGGSWFVIKMIDLKVVSPSGVEGERDFGGTSHFKTEIRSRYHSSKEWRVKRCAEMHDGDGVIGRSIPTKSPMLATSTTSLVAHLCVLLCPARTRQLIFRNSLHQTHAIHINERFIIAMDLKLYKNNETFGVEGIR